MKNKWTSLVSLGLILGMCSTSYAYVMVRSGFGELKHDGKLDPVLKQNGKSPTWDIHNALAGGLGGLGVGLLGAGVPPDNNLIFENCSVFYRAQNSKGFNYKDHKNLSVALGGRFDIFDIGALGVEIEFLGAYANFKNQKRDIVSIHLPKGNIPAPLNMNQYHDCPEFEQPDFLIVEYKKWHNDTKVVQVKPMYLSNQRIVGAQLNLYWEQYILDWLSAGIGGGIGGAYVCTKFSVREQFRALDVENFNPALGAGPANHLVWRNRGTPIQNRSKYAHSGALMYNFMLFLRAEKFETMFEVGYRHIGLHQIFDNKIYGGFKIPKLANMYSDQVYLGVGRTF